MNTTVSVIPAGTQLPARLQTADAAAMIAEANAAAAGGIKTGSAFPRISIEGNKFSIVDGDETTPLTTPSASPGQPPLPMMCLEIAILTANPTISKTFYPGKWVKGQPAEAPACQSSNGVAPDSGVAAPQHSNCAACPKNQWGSKISELSGKEIKACDDSKQLAILPAGDLKFKALGLRVQKGSLRNWGDYVNALSQRNYPVTEVVTNVTFDAAATGVLTFSFNRFLTDVESAIVRERAEGDDAKLIVSQGAIAVRALPAPQGVQFPPETAAVPTAAPVVVDPYAGQPPHVKMAVEGAGGLDSAPGAATYKALTGKDVPVAAPVASLAPVVVDPFAGQPPHVKAAVDGAGGLGTAPGDATYKALTQKDAPVAAATTTLAPAGPATTSVVQAPKGVTAGSVGGFDAAPAAPAAETKKRAPRAKPPEQPAAAGLDPALAHLSPEMLKAVLSVGKDSPGGQAILAACPAPAAAPAAPAPAATAPTAPPPAATGFGGPAVSTVPATGPSPEVSAAASTLAARLKLKLQQSAPPAGATIQ